MRETLRVLAALFPELRLPRWSVPALIALGLVTASTEGLSISLIVPLLQGQAAGGVPGPLSWLAGLFRAVPSDSRVVVIGGTIVLGVFLKNVSSYAYGYCFSWLNAKANHRLRHGLLRRILRASQQRLDRQDAGQLLHVLTYQTWRTNAAFATLSNMLINACMVAIFAALFLLISWRLTILTTAALLLVSCIVRSLTRRARYFGGLAATANSAMTQRLADVFAVLPMVRVFGREQYELRRFERASVEVARTFFQIDRVSGLIGPASETLLVALLLGILVVSARSGTMASTLVFLVLLYRLHPRVRQLDVDRVTLNALAADVQSVRALLVPDHGIDVRVGRLTLPASDWVIRFDSVTLRYHDDGRPALEDITFTVPPRRTTALVGRSGAGKSSVINLICRLRDPTDGRVVVDGIPLPELDLVWWREQIALVSQDVYMLNGTIAENIAYGKLSATQNEVIEAARLAHALEFIEALPAQFDTRIGAAGCRLSGGQRQRIALARAIIREPRVLLLDEATNALDLVSEQLVLDALAAFGRNHTVLVVAHRRSTIEHADHLVVLDAGRVVEQGWTNDVLTPDNELASLYAAGQGSVHCAHHIHESTP